MIPSATSPVILSLLLLISLPLLFILAPRILPPRILPDDPDDVALLRRAAAIHSRPSANPHTRLGITNPTPKIAFLFLTNSDLHFAPLWQRFFTARDDHRRLYNIYVHADPFAPYTDPGGVFKDRLIKSKRTRRASPSLISAARRLIATALVDDSANLFFALLSQQCVPLHSFRFVYRTLLTPPKPPTESTRESGSELTRLGSRVGYQSFIEILSNEPKLKERYTARGSMEPEVPFDKFKVGSQFFILVRRHAVMVVRDTKLWKKFRLPCLRPDACYPEEHYFPTLLSMEDPDGCSHFTLTRVNWTGTAHGHPHAYTPPEVSTELIHKLRMSNWTYSYLFARKFTPECLEPLMKLAGKVIFRD
uniref:Core-2/I-branching beta-1,6-N-acetylglucosaminyltransferase family protein n=1 Tax=Kalanchoe fedtschenkoi TaxID=63787 RepID=A0A7N0RIB1_KALFE